MIGAGSGITDFRKRGASATPPSATSVVYSGVYTGNGGTNAVTGVGFRPDVIMIRRTGSFASYLFDRSIMGVGQTVQPGSNAAQAALGGSVTSFDADGFTLGSNVNTNFNTGVYSFVAFKIAPLFMDALTYEGNGSAGHNIAHAVGATPSFFFTKALSAATAWNIYHEDNGAAGSSSFITSTYVASASVWDSTPPDASQFTVGNNASSNGNTVDSIAVLFADAAGVSKTGIYTGTGAAGNAITGLGFKPKSIIILRNAADNDAAYGNSRTEGDDTVGAMFIGASIANVANAITFDADGFTLAVTSATVNSSGATYSWIAFAN